MGLHFLPLAFGVILVVAVGTIVYTLLHSDWQQQRPYENRRSSNSYSEFEFDETGSTASSASSDSTFSSLDNSERPSRRRRNADRCAICLGTLKNSLKTLTCKHSFHLNCITAWLVKSNKCPICRQLAR